MKEVTNKVFIEISEEDFEYAITKFYEEDDEIQYNLKQYQEEFEKAFLGVKPEIK